jgi:ATP-binding cassette subfamily C protein CydD
LLNLIMGFLVPTEGEIKVNGTSLTRMNPESWRQWITWIGQRPVLCSGTLGDNIRLGNPSGVPGEDELLDAVNQARVDQFLHQLPKGLQTPLGDSGSRLSRGQSQRVAMARAFIKNAPLVIMDEPTAGLDRRNEHMVMDGIGRLARNRTVVIATHRLNATQLHWVDRIVLLDGGRLAELGTYEELMSRKGLFFDLAHPLPSEEVGT